MHGVCWHAQVAGDGRYRHCVGRRDDGGQGKSHGERHLWNHPVDQVAQTDHRKQHQPECQFQNRLVQRKELALGNTPAVGKQQRRNEQQHEQAGIEINVQAILGPRQHSPQHDLYQRQRNGSDVSRNDAGDGADHQHEQDSFNGMHGLWFL
ncbi:hypothetical protein D3C72_1573270 [compost metagenome]